MAFVGSLKNTSWFRNLKPFNQCFKNYYNTLSKQNVPILKSKPQTFVSRRLFFFKKPTAEELKIRDFIPDSYHLIYNSNLEKYVVLAQGISAAAITCLGLFFVFKSEPITEKNRWNEDIRLTDNEEIVYISVFAILAVVLQYIVTKIPVRIYYLRSQKKYILVHYGHYPLIKRKMLCRAGDVMPVSENAFYSDARFKLKSGEEIILFDKYFRRPADPFIMMGIQSDPDDKEK